ncbi:NUDIX hydrolase [Alteromonas gracilis]
MAPAADRPESWEVVSSEDLFRDEWVMALRADRIRAPQGEETFRRLVLEHPGAVIVLAVDEQDRAVVLEQYRHPGQHRFVELPAGLLDAPGEEEQVAAARELAEEAGLAAEHWEHLVTSYPSPGISSERHAIYLATGLSEATVEGFEPHAEEADMTLSRVPIADLVAGVLAGEITDGPTVIAVLALDARRRVGRE